MYLEKSRLFYFFILHDNIKHQVSIKKSLQGKAFSIDRYARDNNKVKEKFDSM